MIAMRICLYDLDKDTKSNYQCLEFAIPEEYHKLLDPSGWTSTGVDNTDALYELLIKPNLVHLLYTVIRIPKK